MVFWDIEKVAIPTPTAKITVTIAIAAVRK
jgi:hypothetical protein